MNTYDLRMPTQQTSDKLANIPEDRKKEIAAAALKLLKIPFCPESPNPGPQTAFLLNFGEEALFGGACGGGKSYAILMAASQFLEVPGYSALILRQSFRDLTQPGALLDVAQDWWGGKPGIHFNQNKSTFYFDCPGGGQSRVVFGFLERVNDKYQYQGGGFQFLGWDELTQHREVDYRYLFSRTRRRSEGWIADVPLRFRATCNPGGQYGDWVHRYFIVPWEMWKLGKGPKPPRDFYPATLDDNPKLDKASYISMMDRLDPVTRAQLLKGDWNIRPEGRMFKREWFPIIDYEDVPTDCQWVRYWDLASTDADRARDPDYTAGALVGRSRAGTYYVLDMRRWRRDAAQNDALVQATARHDGPRVSQILEQDPGAAGKIAVHHYRTQVLDGYNFRSVPARGKNRKTVSAQPVASQAEARNVFLVRGAWNNDWLEEAEVFPDQGYHDDQMDAISGAMGQLAKNIMHALNFSDNQDFIGYSPWKPEQIPVSLADNPALNTIRTNAPTAADTYFQNVIEQRSLNRAVENAWDIDAEAF